MNDIQLVLYAAMLLPFQSGLGHLDELLRSWPQCPHRIRNTGVDVVPLVTFRGRFGRTQPMKQGSCFQR